MYLKIVEDFVRHQCQQICDQICNRLFDQYLVRVKSYGFYTGEIIMDNLAKVDKLAEITGASFEDARRALIACHGETLDAMAYIEMHKKKKNSVFIYKHS